MGAPATPDPMAAHLAVLADGDAEMLDDLADVYAEQAKAAEEWMNRTAASDSDFRAEVLRLNPHFRWSPERACFDQG
jgi:hypothetical protein